MAEEHKIIFTGTMGAGKTTAIAAVSGTTMIRTEAANTDQETCAKATTTVGFDYGEVRLEDDSILRLYGTPGQARFAFVWRVVARGALGLVILVDNSRPDPLADLQVYLNAFPDLVKSGMVVVAIGRMDTHPQPAIDAYYDALQQRDLVAPVLTADARRRDDVLALLDALFDLLATAA